jgi:cell division protein FtsQ
MKKLISTLFWITVLCIAFVLTASMNRKHSATLADEIVVNIYSTPSNHLVSEKDIRSVLSTIPDSLLLSLPGENYFDIEKKLAQSHLIDQVDIYKNFSNRIVIDVFPKNPIARVIDIHNHHYFMDSEGKLFRCSGKSAKVPVVNGYLAGIKISDQYSTVVSLAKYQALRNDIIKMLKYIKCSVLLNDLIDQIYITKNREFELVPKIGKHYIEFGTSDNMEEKFTNLISFYKHGISNTNWGKYRKINLKYKNQVICTKI